MDINIRQAIIDDEEVIFSLAVKLATSFKIEKVTFSKLFQHMLSNQKTDLIIAE